MSNHENHETTRKDKLTTATIDSTEVGFAGLVGLFEQTQCAVQQQATRAINSSLVVRNWLFGWYIVEFEKQSSSRTDIYGKKLIVKLSENLTAKLGKGFSRRTLDQFRQFYEQYQEIGQTLFAKSSGELKNRVQRLMAFTSSEQCAVVEKKIGQTLSAKSNSAKSPYVLEFLGLDEKTRYSETELETAIIDKLEHFLLELGKGFLFEARQKRFTFDEEHFFVDLVFYNRLLRCYVIIDLKIGELKHQDLGQMQMYVNYFDRYVKLADEKDTIGIILCKKKKDSLVEITLPEGANIHATKYQTYLPDKEALKKQLEEAQQEWEAQQNDFSAFDKAAKQVESTSSKNLRKSASSADENGGNA